MRVDTSRRGPVIVELVSDIQQNDVRSFFDRVSHDFLEFNTAVQRRFIFFFLLRVYLPSLLQTTLVAMGFVAAQRAYSTDSRSSRLLPKNFCR